MEFGLQLADPIFLLIEHYGVVLDMMLDRLLSLQLNFTTRIPFSEFLLQLADYFLHILDVLEELRVVLFGFLCGCNL